MKRGLYLVTPDWDNTARLLAVTRAAILGGAVCVQYRHKTATPALRSEQARALLGLTNELNVPLIINDDVTLAREIGAAGVHLGRDDGEFEALRRRSVSEFLIGVSCYGDFERARAVAAVGASYAAFGAMYPSPTKPHAVPASAGLIRRAKEELQVAVACIGGITADNAPPLVAAGADWLAVISDVFNAADPQAQALRFARLYAEHS